MVETKKSTFWNKLFNKGEKGLKGVKKKGVFGVPLELLVERDGADSMLGSARVTIRVPSFIDDVISSMRTMGGLYSLHLASLLVLTFFVQTCQSRVFSGRTEIFVG